jgi:hypothetical protein
MADKIKVTVRQGKNGWWVKCSRDEHIAMGNNAESAMAKMRAHFHTNHPGSQISFEGI